MIKVILRHVNSRRDVYGNTYWIHQITRTKNYNSMWFESPHSSNAEKMVKDAGGYDWGQIYAYHEEIPIRRFNRVSKSTDFPAHGEEQEAIKKFLKS